MTLLEERPEGTYYTGPLDAGIAVARESRYIAEGQVGEQYWVRLCDSQPDDLADDSTLAEWGNGPDRETAWRYALGAYFGPVDEEYDADHLRRLIAEAVQNA